MNFCPKCVDFAEKINTREPSEYRRIVRQLIEAVQQGTLFLVYAVCPLEEILGPTFPGDVLIHKFECLMCGRRFELNADTYHGNVNWYPGEIPGSQNIQSEPN
jgi:hypothetical protein